MQQIPSTKLTDKRRRANERNSLRSTGPTSEEGKRASSQNALKFGFFSRKALVVGESWEEFVQFRDSLWRQLCPRNPIEEHLVEQYIPLAWRLRRLPEIEAFAFTRYGISAQQNQCGPAFGLVASVQTDNILGQLSRYEATLRKNAFKYLEFLWSLRRTEIGEKFSSTKQAEVLEAEVVRGEPACSESTPTNGNQTVPPAGPTPTAAPGTAPPPSPQGPLAVETTSPPTQSGTTSSSPRSEGPIEGSTNFNPEPNLSAGQPPLPASANGHQPESNL